MSGAFQGKNRYCDANRADCTLLKLLGLILDQIAASLSKLDTEITKVKDNHPESQLKLVETFSPDGK